MASTLRKVTILGSSKFARPPIKSCTDANCSGSWDTPRVGPSEPQLGDVFSVCMSVYAPFKSLLGLDLDDSQSYYTAGGTKGARPCIIIETPRRGAKNYRVLLMASFAKSEEADVPAPFKKFLISIPTSRRHVEGNVEHIHTTPEWENSPQYLILISMKCPRSRLVDRWSSRKFDSSKQNFNFYADELALATLERLVVQRYEYWSKEGQYEHSRQEYLKQLEELKEEQTKLLSDKSQKSGSTWFGKRSMRSNIPSLAEIPEEKPTVEAENGWTIVKASSVSVFIPGRILTVIYHQRQKPNCQENKRPAGRSIKSRH